MSEITKLYENVGIKPTKNWRSCLNCNLKTETRYDEQGELYLTCERLEMPEKCPDAKLYYPLCTKEKQLELIKWLALTRPVTINKFIEGWTIEGLVRNSKQYTNFENAISGYINSIYPFLDEHQRIEIREILE